MVHGVVVLLILMVFAPYASMIPLAAMAPILMFVAWNMSERKEFINILKVKNADSLVLVVTFLLTVIGDLIIGVTAGLIFSVYRLYQKNEPDDQYSYQCRCSSNGNSSCFRKTDRGERDQYVFH
ncbi:hypothetical protein BsIDN1_60790 [Bacillus safensis]|uniref:SLC26A/SulP transporter domain-containing protein n=1 Tax=Bacillus safensis TaxID=561879 RepID=A0A5S9MHP2_BACIA|nr:hypothetical protein BsIDN1_60790 [Bacillus safensis]